MTAPFDDIEVITVESPASPSVITIAVPGPQGPPGSGGTGGSSDTITVTDWNDALKNGTYMGLNAANSPVPDTWILGSVVQHNDAWVTQIVHEFTNDSGTDAKTWRRSSHDNSGREWESWKRLRLTEAEQNAVLGDAGLTPNTIVRRDGGGNAWFARVISNDPVTEWNDQLTRKDYVDALGTAVETPNTIARRDEFGALSFTAVGLNGQPNPWNATRKDYVDALGTPSVVANTVARRDGNGWIGVAGIYGLVDPNNAQDAATKNYVDGKTWGVSSLTATGTRNATTYLRGDNTWATIAGGGAVSDASTTTKGIIQLAGDLAGTAAAPTVPGLANKANSSITISAGTGLTGGGDLSANRTLTVSYGSAAGTAVQGNDVRVVADGIATQASIRTLGTGAQQAAAGNHTHTPASIGAAASTTTITAGTGLTGGGDLSANRTLAVAYGSAASTAVQGNDIRVVADGIATQASIRTLGTGAQQAAAGNHTHTATGISDSTSVGRSVLTAVDAPSARTAIGAGTSNLAIGTTSTTAKAGDYQPTAANISDSTTIGRSILTAATAAAARSATGAGVVDSSDATVLNIVKITQAAYDALGTKVATTLYVIVG